MRTSFAATNQGGLPISKPPILYYRKSGDSLRESLFFLAGKDLRLSGRAQQTDSQIPDGIEHELDGHRRQ